MQDRKILIHNTVYDHIKNLGFLKKKLLRAEKALGYDTPRGRFSFPHQLELLTFLPKQVSQRAQLTKGKVHSRHIERYRFPAGKIGSV